MYVRRKRCEHCRRDNAAAKKKPDGAPGLYRLRGLPGVLGAFDTSVNWHPFLCQPLCRQVMDHDQGGVKAPPAWPVARRRRITSKHDVQEVKAKRCPPRQRSARADIARLKAGGA